MQSTCFYCRLTTDKPICKEKFIKAFYNFFYVTFIELKEVIIKKEAELAEIKNETEDLNEYKVKKFRSLTKCKNFKISYPITPTTRNINP